jgi:hypothetical protein
MRVACARCGVEVEAGLDPSCSKCGAPISRAEIDLGRLKGQFLAARSRAAEVNAAEAKARAVEQAAELTARCPRCGDDLFMSEFGCPKCREGRRPFLARNPGVIAATAFVIPLLAGVGAFLVVGKAPKSGPIANLAFIVGGSIASGLGVRVMTKPGNFTLSASHGTDAFGQPIYGSSHRATPEEGFRFGAIFIVVGLAVIALGVFFGFLAA